MVSDYSMFRYFKEEHENPFNHKKKNIASNYWFYKSIFQKNCDSWDSPE